jgi:hypothetical protein
VRISAIAMALSIGAMTVPASAQDAGAPDAGTPDAGTSDSEPASGAPPSLEVGLEPDPTHEPTPERVPLLERIGPSDPRVARQGFQLPAEEPAPPPLFGIAIGAGFSRLLANIAIDYVRLEQRFEARIPELTGFFVGAGVAELFDPTSLDRFIIEVGPRAGFGASFCDDRLVRCDGVVLVQPGVAAGHLGVQFDFQAALEVRFLLLRLLELSAGGTFSFVGSATFVSLAGNIGLAF